MAVCGIGRASAGMVIAVIVAIFAATAGPVVADHAKQLPAVRLHENAQVEGAVVVLGDIAGIEAEEDIGNILASVEIGPSPLAGHERTISASYVQMRLAHAGFGMGTVAFTGAPAVRVWRETARAQVAQDSAENKHIALRSAPAKSPQIVMKRGEKVQILVRNGGIVIITTGQVLEECCMGHMTTARVAGTGRCISAKVTGPRELTVSL